jgi:hypothetical protein
MQHYSEWAERIRHTLEQRTNNTVYIELQDDYAPFDIGLAQGTCPGGKLLRISLSVHASQENAHANRSRIETCLRFWAPKFNRLISAQGKVALFSSGDNEIAGRLCMDSSHQEYLIPDIYAMQAALKLRCTKGFAPSTYDEFMKRWHSKSRYMFWRGRSTGLLPNGLPPRTLSEFRSLPRIDVATRVATIAGFDVKITEVVQLSRTIKDECIDWLKKSGSLGSITPEDIFQHFRYYPDIPGNSNAWGTIFKYISGSLVFKPVTSSALCYYSDLEPWRHYIPLTEDLSDLEDKHEWAEANTSASAEIAWNGRLATISYLRDINRRFAERVNNYLDTACA